MRLTVLGCAGSFPGPEAACSAYLVEAQGFGLLIDFGSARGEMISHSRTVSALVKPGYSPYEQYATTASKQGPWTDIYGLAATLYHAITGKIPPSSIERMLKDTLEPLGELVGERQLDDEAGEGQLARLDHALPVRLPGGVWCPAEDVLTRYPQSRSALPALEVVVADARPSRAIVARAEGLWPGVVVGHQQDRVARLSSLESREQILLSAKQVAAAGGKFLRGGAFKPRSSPYSFQGMGLEGLKLLRDVADETGLLVITEVMEISQIELMLPYIDVFQIGARNM